MTENKAKKTLTAVVSKLPKDKTIVVGIETKFRHPRYGKTVKVHKKFLVHFDSTEEIKLGDLVEIVEVKPFSKRKNWMYLRKLEIKKD